MLVNWLPSDEYFKKIKKEQELYNNLEENDKIIYQIEKITWNSIEEVMRIRNLNRLLNIWKEIDPIYEKMEKAFW